MYKSIALSLTILFVFSKGYAMEDECPWGIPVMPPPGRTYPVATVVPNDQPPINHKKEPPFHSYLGVLKTYRKKPL